METKQHDTKVCDPNKTGRHDQECSDCQNRIRRDTKTKNRYLTHGPCQTPATRLYGRSK